MRFPNLDSDTSSAENTSNKSRADEWRKAYTELPFLATRPLDEHNIFNLSPPDPKPRIHLDRTPGGDRDYRDFGGDVVADPSQSQDQSAGHQVHEQFPSNHAGGSP